MPAIEILSSRKLSAGQNTQDTVCKSYEDDNWCLRWEVELVKKDSSYKFSKKLLSDSCSGLDQVMVYKSID